MSDPEAPPRERVFVLELPAEPPFLATARVFASAIARQAGCQEAVVDDVKLAISEAWAAVTGSEPVGSIRLEIAREGGRLRFGVRTAGGRSGPPNGVWGEPWPGGIELVRLLFEDAELLEDDLGAMARFSVALEPGR
ncbi:MAG TPA: ATP-binding protein [Actinomycetota bacterium]|nr:ATP-binding protein [Actinomycetota bacterium]